MLTTIISFIIVFGILVFVHEFGHFIVAKRAGLMVREFSIGMGPKLFFYHYHQTTYTLRLLPIGGYVLLAGNDDDEVNQIKPGTDVRLQLNQAGIVTKIDLSRNQQLLQGIPFQVAKADLVNTLEISGYENGAEEIKKQYQVDHDALIVQPNGIALQIAPVDVQFQNAPVWKKLLVNLAGIVNNILLAIVAFTVLAFLQGGVSKNTNQIQISNVKPAIAKQAGLQNGDRITTVNGQKTANFTDLSQAISKLPGKRAKLTVKRGQQEKDVVVKLGSKKVQKQRVGYLGITAAVDHSLRAKFLAGFSRTWMTAKQLFGALWYMVSGHFSLNDLGGPVAIFATTSQATSYGMVGVISFLAWLSINLAIVNLIPIPALDGGKILLNVIEMLRGKPLSERFETLLTIGGFVFLIGLMLLVTWNDIMRYFIR
ncbi:Membrane-associated zinc metalloprotease [Fructilactobacillus florum 8D]|uniref:Zinc metalloprotease n=3 Tax=Fructilactobacillus florum TaxID=640331 RepID=W9EFM4_9LACO|nr:RIP metalloprotease RseP [Fructilactobacillus florum]EKK20223.1 Membrane-associated zinc metalloprotease [Fructilactobacillus florum 2F]ETO40908.1 Membrane-associated zinc metalloprotease [Fructilactobacillus florum 8D]KRM91391.1 protease eep [Fructilactobacillus florum DSM 22689 = JCM 16035]